MKVTCGICDMCMLLKTGVARDFTPVFDGVLVTDCDSPDGFIYVVNKPLVFTVEEKKL